MRPADAARRSPARYSRVQRTLGTRLRRTRLRRTRLRRTRLRRTRLRGTRLRRTEPRCTGVRRALQRTERRCLPSRTDPCRFRHAGHRRPDRGDGGPRAVHRRRCDRHRRHRSRCRTAAHVDDVIELVGLEHPVIRSRFRPPGRGRVLGGYRARHLGDRAGHLRDGQAPRTRVRYRRDRGRCHRARRLQRHPLHRVLRGPRRRGREARPDDLTNGARPREPSGGTRTAPARRSPRERTM
ncbi:pentapeptide repeat-containing protein [Microbacterium sp. P02]|uniref:pentapeptide repeat-containing protein n=1 Tax=Microbacterium sp. P02 TaxID=3366260 RepID=UPI00366F48A3